MGSLSRLRGKAVGMQPRWFCESRKNNRMGKTNCQKTSSFPAFPVFPARLCKTRTFRTQAMKHIIGCMASEAFRQVDMGHRQVRHAEGAVATFTSEMDVKVVDGRWMCFAAMAMFLAQGILLLPASVFHTMHQVVRQEQGQGAEDGGFVDGFQSSLQITQRFGHTSIHQGTQDENTQGGRLDVTMQKLFFAIKGIHATKLRVYFYAEAWFCGLF